MMGYYLIYNDVLIKRHLSVAREDNSERGGGVPDEQDQPETNVSFLPLFDRNFYWVAEFQVKTKKYDKRFQYELVNDSQL